MAGVWRTQVILSLMDNWSNPGGIDQIVAWSSTAQQRTDFFSDQASMELYQSSVAKIITRVNTINGRRSVCSTSCPRVLRRLVTGAQRLLVQNPVNLGRSPL